jgi:hypothetical protein
MAAAGKACSIAFDFGLRSPDPKLRSKLKGGGQECPTYTVNTYCSLGKERGTPERWDLALRVLLGLLDIFLDLLLLRVVWISL